MVTRQEIEAAFRERVKSIVCPNCELEFTDFAVDWGNAWLEGRLDLMNENGWQERDGPYKIKCELCGKRFWLDYFAWTVTSVETHSSCATSK